MSPRYFLTIAFALSLTLPAFAQTTNVTIQPDLRLFTTMAALNAAGYDVEFGSGYGPVREAVRKYAQEVDAEYFQDIGNVHHVTTPYHFRTKTVEDQARFWLACRFHQANDAISIAY